MTKIFENNWQDKLSDQFKASYMQELRKFLLAEKNAGNIVYPEPKNVFRAFDLTCISKVKVVIIGQDPYHGEQQANGLCFSVQKGLTIPPSLVNIFKELIHDCGISKPTHGDLTNWSKQGVLLLNTVLTVRKNAANSHKNLGWETFTDYAIKLLQAENRPIIYLLWGNSAIAKSKLITCSKSMVLTTTHPSPLSAHRGFLGCKHFSKAVDFIKTHYNEELNWQI